MGIRGRGFLLLPLAVAIPAACSPDGPAPVARPAPTPVRWLATLDATELHGAVVDYAGDLFVLAWEFPSSTSDELVPHLDKFAGATGSWLWSTSLGSSATSRVTPWSLAAGLNAQYWVAGLADLTPGAGPIADRLVSPAAPGDRFVSQFDPITGDVTPTHARPRIFPMGLAADVDGGIFVSGTGSNERGSDLGMIRRIDDSTGALSWEVFVDFDISSVVYDVDVDAAGGLCVGGVVSHELATFGGWP